MIYEQQCLEAHNRLERRRAEAHAERNIRQARARRHRRRRLLQRLIYARA